MDELARLAVTTLTLLTAQADPRLAAADAIAAANAQPPRQEVLPPDRWIGDDKLRHFAMSFAITSLSFAAARSAGAGDAALPASVAAAAAAGLGKEFYDRRTAGRFSHRDLVWDALGVLAGYALVRNIE